ncbi:uncharacterized protein LOC135492941 [Lineus longissimus]|uniref:uncharacterized protein LOC135492941 n=1 Tax=Lineus longissimus TaxID=88925 RepID=UPI00315CE1D5
MCLKRVIENWDALKQLFREASESLPEDQDCKERRLFKFYRSPTNKLLCPFLVHTMKIFDNANKRLQQQAPLIHELRQDLNKLVRDLLLRYKMPEAIRHVAIENMNVTTELGQRQDADLFIGEEARNFIADKDNNGLRGHRIKDFFSGVRKFFIAACSYLKEKLPLQEPLLKHAEVADTKKRINGAQAADLGYFLDTFPALIPEGVSRETVELEFAEYQSESEIPVAEGIDDIDKKWVQIGKMEDGGGVPMFKNLAHVILGILTIPHSNAQCERVFSSVRQNKTWNRSSMVLKQLNHSY